MRQAKPRTRYARLHEAIEVTLGSESVDDLGGRENITVKENAERSSLNSKSSGTWNASTNPTNGNYPSMRLFSLGIVSMRRILPDSVSYDEDTLITS